MSLVAEFERRVVRLRALIIGVTEDEPEAEAAVFDTMAGMARGERKIAEASEAEELDEEEEAGS